jgi:hypothetical protein
VAVDKVKLTIDGLLVLLEVERAYLILDMSANHYRCGRKFAVLTDGIKDALGCQGRQDLRLELLQIFEAAMTWARSCLGMLNPPCETFRSLGNGSLKHPLTSRVRSFYLYHLGTFHPCLIPLSTGPDHFHFKIVLPHPDVPCHMVRHMRIRGAVIW